MQSLVESLVSRRLKDGTIKLVGQSHHAATVFNAKNFDSLIELSYGENHFRPTSEIKSIHAEHHAIQKLPQLPKKHHQKKVDILIVKTSKTGCLGMSKPCIHCLMIMNDLAPKKGYRINKVYYTDDKGNLIENRLNKLILEENYHISKYYRL